MRLRGTLSTALTGAAFALALSAGSLAAQATGTITGTVVDATSGRTLESAQVFVPSLNMGGLSNAQGRFLLLNVPTGTHELRVELIGYTPTSESVTVQAGQSTTVEVRMNSTALRLQELVVTGVAGETPRVKLPFTVEKVDFEEMPVPASSAEGLLQGKVAGVAVVKGSGQPGDESSVMLRGPSSITGSQQPLIIVDGVITDNTMADIAALDVASIEVVKGPAAASLYGSRAQNGVIQIATKRGAGLAEGSSRVIVRNEFGTQQLTGHINLASSHVYQVAPDGSGFVSADESCPAVIQWKDAGRCGVVLNGATPSTTFQDQAFPGPVYDQLDRFFDPGNFMSNYVAVEGRSGNTNYRASFENNREGGVIQGHDGYHRRNFRLNVDHQVFDNLDVSLNTYYAQSKQDEIGTGPFFALTLMHQGSDLTEIDPQTGKYVVSPDPLSLEVNPLYQVKELQDTDKRQRFMSSVFARYSPATWFDLEGNYSIDRYDLNTTDITPVGYQSEADAAPTQGDLFRENRLENDVNASLTASFNHAFGDLTTRTKLRYLLEDQHMERFEIDGNDLAVADVPVLQNVIGNSDIESAIEDVISEGYFFISALDYAGKYIGDFLVRRDGSSLFGEDERWQTYYRASAAWRLAQEDWWPIEALDEFKLRYSIGTAGGRPQFDAQYETYSVEQGTVRPVTLGNKQLRPELATEQEFGLETVWFDRVAAGVAYSKSLVEDQLLEVPLASVAGFETQWRNAGELESNTFEGYVEGSVIQNPDMGLSFRVNFDRTRQEITRLDIPPYRVGPGDEFFVREGEALGTFYGVGFAHACTDLPAAGPSCGAFDVNDDGYLVWVGDGFTWQDGITDGRWGMTSADGAYEFGMPIRTLNDDGLPFVRLGNTTPDYTLSFSTNFRWKGVGLYALVDAVQGYDVYNQTAQWAYRELRHGDTDQTDKSDAVKKPFAYYTTLYATNSRSQHFVEDGSFAKLRELSLRYTINEDQLSHVFGGFGLSGATINLIGRNLFTWTDYSGYDPEVGGSGTGDYGGAAAIGRIDTYQYPNFRTLSASLELVF